MGDMEEYSVFSTKNKIFRHNLLYLYSVYAIL